MHTLEDRGFFLHALGMVFYYPSVYTPTMRLVALEWRSMNYSINLSQNVHHFQKKKPPFL